MKIQDKEISVDPVTEAFFNDIAKHLDVQTKNIGKCMVEAAKKMDEELRRYKQNVIHSHSCRKHDADNGEYQKNSRGYEGNKGVDKEDKGA